MRDEAAEGEVGDEVGGAEREHGGRARGAAGVEPPLDGGPVVGDAGAEADGRAHDVERDRAAEEAGDLDLQALVLRGQPHGRLLPDHRKLATRRLPEDEGMRPERERVREVVRVVVYGRKRKSDGGGLVVASDALLYRARVKRNSYYFFFSRRSLHVYPSKTAYFPSTLIKTKIIVP